MATDLVEDAPIWGKGWEGYDDQLSLTENVRKKFGRSNYFDAVLAYCAYIWLAHLQSF